MLSTLKKYWGYDAFRPRQEEIISQALEGKDVLALMPTGGGKSICFQVPAMMKEGICIVVSPLIALMKDQVENLRKRGIPALLVCAGMTYREIDATLDNAVYGDYKFLYVSPERLRTDLFLARASKMNRWWLARCRPAPSRESAATIRRPLPSRPKRSPKVFSAKDRASETNKEISLQTICAPTLIGVPRRTFRLAHSS